MIQIISNAKIIAYTHIDLTNQFKKPNSSTYHLNSAFR